VVSLRKLKLKRPTFNDIRDQALFVEAMSSLEAPLNTLAILNPTSLTWMFENPELLVHMWSNLEAARETLKYLKLCFETPGNKIYDLPLWKMHFPCLKSISLSIRSLQLDGVLHAFAEFVVAHGSTLEELEVASEEENEFAVGLDYSETLESDYYHI